MTGARALAAAIGLSLLFVGPAAAFDCGKATTASEMAICADPAALAADADLSKAYAALLNGLEPAQKPQLAAAQIGWLRRRDAICASGDIAAKGACLARETRERALLLAGRPDAGPGAPGRLGPWFRIEKGGKGKAAIDFELLRFFAPARPAERAFNAAALRLTQDAQPPEADDPAADRYAYELKMRLAYASPRLISAVVDGYADTGGAHPNAFTSAINIDVETGRELTFDDLLDAAGARQVFALCAGQVEAQKRGRMGADAPDGAPELKKLAANVAEASHLLTAWSFGADKASIAYDAYAVGSYAEGPYGCEIPYATLRPLAKAKFPLP